MALVRYGNGVSELRGSIAGNVFSRGRAGAIVRNRTTPVNPNTQAQADFRYLFSQTAANYTTLTKSQQEAWTEYAQMLTFWRNRLGEPYTPSGRQVFQYCNTNLALANATLDPTTAGAPSYNFPTGAQIVVPNFDLVTKPDPPLFNGGDKSFDLAVTAGVVSAYASAQQALPPNATDDIQRFIVEATPVMRPTMRNRSNLFRFINTYNGAVATAIEIVDDFNSVFNQSGLTAGLVGLVRISTVNKGGLRSDPVEITAVAVSGD